MEEIVMSIVKVKYHINFEKSKTKTKDYSAYLSMALKPYFHSIHIINMKTFTLIIISPEYSM